MRHHHYLKANKSVELPQHMIFVDTETKGERVNATTENHRLWFGYACYIRARADIKSAPKEEWIKFNTIGEFWDWVETKTQRKTRTWLFAHNWNYDAAILDVSGQMPKRGWTMGKYINEKPPVIVDLRKNTSTLRLVDSMNYFNSSLAGIGESIGVEKLPFPKSTDTLETWETYGRRDVEILKQAILGFRAFVSTHELGNFQFTLASQAFSAYRHRFMNEKILIHAYEKDSELERQGFFGGRSECFQLGEVNEKLYYLDINSQYPSMMVDNPFPAVHLRSVNNPTLAAAKEYLKKYCVVAYCHLKTDEPAYPLKINSRLCFPIGEFETVLNTPEISYALAKGHLLKISRMVIYKKALLFPEYVRYFYALRQQYKIMGNETYQYMCKLMLNSLYGKFGQSGSRWEDLPTPMELFEGITYEQETPDSPVRTLRCRLGQVQVYKRSGESQNSFPAISAHVTAYGRMGLWKLIRKAGRENVFYTDTDSLIVSQAGFDLLHSEIDPSKLGALKVEDTQDNAHFWGLKDYRFGVSTRHKGIKRNARQLGTDRWEQEKFTSWDYLMSKGLDGYVPIETITKKLHRNYKKGVVVKSGRVTPFILG